VQGHAQFVRHDLGDLGVQALPHFGATMVDLHTSIQIDMHQSPGLVKQGGCEADAKLDWRDGQTPFERDLF
jgi:hypothetical protein